jgi:hypothetical protein
MGDQFSNTNASGFGCIIRFEIGDPRLAMP